MYDKLAVLPFFGWVNTTESPRLQGAGAELPRRPAGVRGEKCEPRSRGMME